MHTNYKMLYESVGYNIDHGLRHLSDMTEEEIMALAKIHDSEAKWKVVDRNPHFVLIMDEYESKVFIHFDDDGNLWDCEDASGSISSYGTFEAVKYLLSRGFDLFGLIEENLALDKTKLKDRGL